MLFATRIQSTAPKVRKSPPKKPTLENGGAQKSVEKMQARGNTCFLHCTLLANQNCNLIGRHNTCVNNKSCVIG